MEARPGLLHQGLGQPCSYSLFSQVLPVASCLMPRSQEGHISWREKQFPFCTKLLGKEMCFLNPFLGLRDGRGDAAAAGHGGMVTPDTRGRVVQGGGRGQGSPHQTGTDHTESLPSCKLFTRTRWKPN